MSNQYRLSVVIPNFNHAGYLQQCIDSVLTQTVKDIEIVIADDGSTDESRVIIEDYASRESRIKAIFNKERLQVSLNRHRAILESSAEFITTLDSDDFFCSNCKIERELALIRQYRDNTNQEVCAFSNIILVDENGKFISHQWQDDLILQGDVFSGIFSRTCMIPRDFTFSRALYLRSGGYDPSFNLYEDWDLKIRLARIASFYYTGIEGVAYRRKGSGLSYDPYEKHVDAIRKIYQKNKGIIKPSEKEFINQGLSGYLQEFSNK